MMRQTFGSALLGSCLLVMLAMGPVGALASPQIVTFDVPGSSGTVPLSINAKGAITGYCGDNSGRHGFVRQPDGTVATFDVPGADPAFGTAPASINNKGYITGNYATLNDKGHDIPHVFVRSPDGTIDTFGVPNNNRYDYPVKITTNRTVIGSYTEGRLHYGFIQPRHGAAAIFQSHQDDTVVTAANNLNVATGWAPSYRIAFVRAVDGTFTYFNGGSATRPLGISDSGTIVGAVDSEGFIRTPDGTITTFVVDGSQTIAASVNIHDTLTGYTLENSAHGFVRDANGEITVFDPDGSLETAPQAINDHDVITGYYFSENQDHGFIRYP